MPEEEFDEEKETNRQKAHECLSEADQWLVFTSQSEELEEGKVKLTGMVNVDAPVEILAHMIAEFLKLNKEVAQAIVEDNQNGCEENNG